jgi:ADP-ribose pyrophosphatase YjhB (NUDIX family)
MRLGATGEAPRFLLLRGRDTGIWSFSKGHPEEEDGGDPLRTALRETREETGYELGRDYTLVGESSIRLGKRPYWVGLLTAAGMATRPRLAFGEHSDAGWFTWSEVGRLVTNTDVRAWVKKAIVPSSGFARLMASAALPVNWGVLTPRSASAGLTPVLSVTPEPVSVPVRESESASRRPTHLSSPVCIAS